MTNEQRDERWDEQMASMPVCPAQDTKPTKTDTRLTGMFVCVIVADAAMQRGDIHQKAFMLHQHKAGSQRPALPVRMY